MLVLDRWDGKAYLLASIPTLFPLPLPSDKLVDGPEEVNAP